MSESFKPKLGPVRFWALLITGLAFLAFLFPLKVYIHGIAWNDLPPLAWKALPRTLVDNRPGPTSAKVYPLADNEEFRLLYWAWITRHRSGWHSETRLYPPGITIIADTVRLSLLPDQNRAVMIYRAPIADGTSIELVKEFKPGDLDELVKAVAGLSEEPKP